MFAAVQWPLEQSFNLRRVTLSDLVDGRELTGWEPRHDIAD
jgi:hypothetical protein